MELLARGRSADVFLDGDEVVRRDRRGRTAESSAVLLRTLAAQGIPVPEVLDAAGAELRMRRVLGRDLFTLVRAGSITAQAACERTGALHRLLDGVLAPDFLPVVAGAPPDCRTIVHLDLHPGNVIDSPSGPVLIDWENAARGPRELDVAFSVLLLLVAPELDALMDAAGRRAAAEALAGAAGRDPRQALAAAARLRLDDPGVGSEERRRVHELLRRTAPAAPGSPTP